MTGDDQLSTSFHVLHRQECTSVPRPEGCAELGPGSCHQARPLPFWLVCLHVPFFLCSASRMPQGSWTSNSPSCPTHHRSSAPCICYWWLLVSDSKSLVFAYSATNGSGPSYIRDMVKPYTPSHPLLSMTAKPLATPSLEGPPSAAQYKLFFFCRPDRCLPKQPMVW